MALDSLALHTLTEDVLGCVCAALDDVAGRVDGAQGCPCVACVHPGQPAWDSCCECLPGGQTGGQLNVWVERIYPFTRFPDQIVEAHKCLPAGTGTAVDLVVTLLRCAPTVDDLGNPPSCDELARTARIVHLDMLTVFSAVTCCVPQTGGGRRGRRFLVREHKTVGPEGGCVGSELRVAVDLGQPCLCPTETSP